MNNRLADMTTADVLEFIEANPGLIPHIANFDSRVKLLETLDKNPKHRKALRLMSKEAFPNAAIAEVDLPAEYEAKLKERDDKIAKLEERLDTSEKTTRYQGFRGRLRRLAAEAEDEALEDITEGTLDEIITFMKDNDFGEKSAANAVEAFYKTKAPATPSSTEARSPLEGAADDTYMQKLLKASPSDDLYALGMPDIERVFHEEFTGSPTKRRPQLA